MATLALKSKQEQRLGSEGTPEIMWRKHITCGGKYETAKSDHCIGNFAGWRGDWGDVRTFLRPGLWRVQLSSPAPESLREPVGRE